MAQHTIPPVSPIALGLPAACVGATQSLLIVALPVMLALTELEIGQLSPLLGVAALGYLAGAYTWPRRVAPGRRHQLLGRLLCVATGSQALFITAVFAAAHGLLGVVATASALFITRFVYALTAAGVFPTIHAWLLSEHAATARHAAMTRMSATVNAGRVLVPLIAAGLTMFWPQSALALLVMLPLGARLLLPQEYAVEPGAAPRMPPRSLPEAAIALPATFAHMSLGLTEFVIGPYLAAEWAIPLAHTPAYTALLLAGAAACMVTAQLASLRLDPDPGSLLSWAPAGMALGSALATVYPPALPAGLALVAVAFALLLPALGTGAAVGRDANAQTRVSADLYTARLIGHLLGVTAAGPLFEVAPRLPLAAAALLALIVIPCGAGLRRALANAA